MVAIGMRLRRGASRMRGTRPPAILWHNAGARPPLEASM
jgi:hypothetical protein